MAAPTSSLTTLAPLPRSVLFHLCLSDEEILAFDIGERTGPAGLSDSAWLRHELLLATCHDPDLHEAIADHLDLKFAGEVLRVRASAPEELSLEVLGRIGRAPTPEFRGVLWALLSDEREDARCLGIFWCQTWLGQLLHEGAASS